MTRHPFRPAELISPARAWSRSNPPAAQSRRGDRGDPALVGDGLSGRRHGAISGGFSDGASRYLVEAGGVEAGAVSIRHPWLKGPYLELLALLPPFQRRGIGAGIPSWFEQEGRGSARAISGFAPHRSTSGALRFYQRHGFGRRQRCRGWWPTAMMRSCCGNSCCRARALRFRASSAWRYLASRLAGRPWSPPRRRGPHRRTWRRPRSRLARHPSSHRARRSRARWCSRWPSRLDRRVRRDGQLGAVAAGLDGDGMGFGVDIGNGERLGRKREQHAQSAKRQTRDDPHREFPLDSGQRLPKRSSSPANIMAPINRKQRRDCVSGAAQFVPSPTWVSGRRRTAPAMPTPPIYHPPRPLVATVSRGVKNGRSCCEPNPAWSAFTGALRCLSQRYCAVQQEQALAMTQRPLTTRSRVDGHASDRKGASDGTHSLNYRRHGDHVVQLSRRHHPRDDLGRRAVPSQHSVLLGRSGFACPALGRRLGDAPGS